MFAFWCSCIGEGLQPIWPPPLVKPADVMAASKAESGLVGLNWMRVEGATAGLRRQGEV